MEYPNNEPNCASSGCAKSRTLIGLPAAATFESVLDGLGVAHEVGHVLEAQLFEQDSFTVDCSANGGGWVPTSTEYQSCATREGWAMYVAAVSWWTPSNSGSSPTYAGFNLETSTPHYNHSGGCAANISLPGQVARAFWDLDDGNDEQALTGDQNAGFHDTLNETTAAIALGWDVFLDGYANHKDKESDSNGVNVRDYDFNHNVNDDAFFGHNCLQATVDE
jgi:hypothetical protein